MTPIDVEKLREAKRSVTQRLLNVDIGSYHLRSVDIRLDIYVREVIGNPDAHCLWEQLAVERFLRMCRKYGINKSEVFRFFTLYENLSFPGKQGLQCYELTPVQAFQFASIYGFWSGGRRVVKEAVLFVPRKFSKTTSTAALIVDDLLYGDANAESYVGANSQDQARKCFDVVRGCMRKLDPDGRRFTVNLEVIKSRLKGRTAIAQCLTANARTKDGLNASTVVMDEFSQARDNTLLTVLTTSMGVRENPLTVIITTASDVFDGPFYSMLQGYKRTLLGEYDDDGVFIHLFEPDVDDAEDSEATWRKVHPHIGVTVSIDFYRQEYKAALRNGAEAMMAFRTKLLNLYSDNARRSWIPASLAQSVSRRFTFDQLKGRPEAMVAVDLSVSGDFSCVSTAFYDKTKKTHFFYTRYFFPEGALSGHPNEHLYRKWASDGHLILTPGPVIDYRTIVDYIIWLNQKVRVIFVGYDRYKADELINVFKASHAGASRALREVSQLYGNFTAPVQSFEYGIKTGHIFIDDNPINAYCFGNAVLDYDRLENCKPVKRTETQRIDGVITMLMCLRLWIDTRQPAK